MRVAGVYEWSRVAGRADTIWDWAKVLIRVGDRMWRGFWAVIEGRPGSTRRPVARLVLAIVMCLLAGAAAGPGHARAASGSLLPQERIVTRFVPLTAGTTLGGLSRGQPGRGLLLYYRRGEPLTSPSLVVQLWEGRGSAQPRARVYTAPVGRRFVPVQVLGGGRVVLQEGLRPSIDIQELGAAWVRNGFPNYDLNVAIYGPVQAMWGSGPLSGGSPGYVGRLGPHELAYHIIIRAAPDGEPLWDLRTLVPTFPGSGYVRGNYAQRECFTHISWGSSPSPDWPFVAFSGGFLQPSGEVVPPIVVNWSTGKVTTFSEVVSVRLQRCSYDFYSLTPILIGKNNKPDFESPWGLYNLAGSEHGYPSLVIRNEHFGANDPWSVGTDPQRLTAAPLNPRQTEDIRYSWADHPGNLLFNYKVDVFGFLPYSEYVPIAGGRSRVLAPPYGAYPSWVVGHRWPSTTFIDTNGGGYASSEGIYQWPAQSVGTRYWSGWSAVPNLKALGPLPVGLRGEYRVGTNHRPWLYGSNIDRKLHLLYAQGGLWNLGGGDVLRESNLTGGPYIDAWTLAKQVAAAGSNSKVPGPSYQTVSSLYELKGYLIYGGAHGIVIRKARGVSNSFRTLPPTNHASWVAFVHAVKPYRSGRNPRHLYTWVQAFRGSAFELPGARLVRVVAEARGFQLQVSLPATVHPSGELPGLKPLSGVREQVWLFASSPSGGQWEVAATVGPRLSAQGVGPAALRALHPGVLHVRVRDAGNVDWNGTVTVSHGDHVLVTRQMMIHGGSTALLSVAWSPAAAGAQTVSVRAAGLVVGRFAVLVASAQRAAIFRLGHLSGWNGWGAAMGLLLLSAGGVLAAWRRPW